MFRQLSKRAMSLRKDFEFIKPEVQGKVAIITLNRPKALNALNDGLMREVNEALKEFEQDGNVHVAILAGSEKAFAAGADIKQMADTTLPNNYKTNFLGHWAEVSKFRKPLIAAVNGFALGGGCELAMMCDIIVAGDKAVFGQPEIKLGTIPGAGGSQRLPHAVGKSNAMWSVLSGETFSAQQAKEMNLVTAVYPASELLDKTKEMANKIARHSVPILMMAKEAVLFSYDVAGLDQGLQMERRLFQASFGFEDRREGMAAFVDKRKPNFKNE